MEPSNNDPNGRPDMLSSSEYRARLMTKLNCLIAVLEVAIGKISKSMGLPGANEERLLKIRTNLENTLAICHRAKQTLEKTSNAKTQAVRDAEPNKMTARDYVELSSIDEYRKFKRMTPIQNSELQQIDFDELARRLADS